jgi:hypothetical protein
MRAEEAVAHVVTHSGKTGADVSREMGRVSTFVATTIGRGTIPKLDTFARIAGVCGYEVVLKGHGEEVVVEYD